MTAAHKSSGSGKFTLFVSIAVFTVALVVLLMTAGLGNATQTPEARVPVAVSTGTVKIQSGFETPINVLGLSNPQRLPRFHSIWQGKSIHYLLKKVM